MREVNEMPTSGQFVALWVCGEKIWGETYEWRKRKLYRYDPSTGDFEPDLFAAKFCRERQTRYFVA